MKIFTILTKSNILNKDTEEIECWEIAYIPTQLATMEDPILLYEVLFSETSTIKYTNNTIQANRCYLKSPYTVHQFLTEYHMWIGALRKSGLLIREYKGEKSEHLCVEAVSQNGMALQHIEAPYQSEEVCMYAVYSNWESLQFVLKQSERVCKAALERSGKAIQYVRELTPELCSLAIRNEGGVEFLQSMPEDVRRMAVQRNGKFLQYIPAEKQTNEICRLAIANTPSAIQWVADQTEELCCQAVCEDGMLLKYIQQQTPAVCATALLQNGLALQYVKEYMLSDICSYAQNHQISSIHFLERPKDNAWANGFVVGIACVVGAICLALTHTRMGSKLSHTV